MAKENGFRLQINQVLNNKRSAAGNHFKPGLREALRPARLPEAVAPLITFLASPACRQSGEAYAAGCGR